MSELWFRARRYGWGWTPATWQGWAVIIVYLVAVVGWAAWLVFRPYAMTDWHASAAALMSVLPILVLSAVLVAIAWLKGERPHWRWGK